MTLPAGHDELREMLPAAALGILEPADLKRVMVHARECDACAEELAEGRRVVADLGLLLPPRSMEPGRSAALRARLLARARGGSRARPRGPALLAVQWSGWLVAAGLAGVLLMHHSVHRPLAYGWFVAGGLAVILALLAGYLRSLRGRMRSLEDRLAAREEDLG